MHQAQSSPPRPGPVAYSERLGVPWRWWVQGLMLVASLWLAVVIALPEALAWAVTGLAMALMAAWFTAYGSARVTLADGVLTAGRARIDVRHLGTAVALDHEQTRLAYGRDADARAYLLLRPYLKRSVKVAVTDPRDPVPYWLISTRRPVELAAALERATGGSAGR